MAETPRTACRGQRARTSHCSGLCYVNSAPLSPGATEAEMDAAKAAMATSRLIAMDGPPQQPQADDDGRHDGKQQDGVVQGGT
jgi:hypothetical protein